FLHLAISGMGPLTHTAEVLPSLNGSITLLNKPGPQTRLTPLSAFFISADFQRQARQSRVQEPPATPWLSGAPCPCFRAPGTEPGTAVMTLFSGVRCSVFGVRC